MEHFVYICSWTRSSAGVALWVKSRPQIRGESSTYADAEEKLIEAIQNDGGAMQAVLEFDPPLPKSTLEEKYSNPEIQLIGGDDGFETIAPEWNWSEGAQEIDEPFHWQDAFYEVPRCWKCKYTSGRRSDKPLTLKHAPSGYDGAVGSVGIDRGPSHQIVSERFLALLTAGEKRRLEFRQTILKGRRKFYELIGPEGPPLVAVAGMKLSGWRCSECDHRTWGYWIDDMAIHFFVARSDLPVQMAGVFTVGQFPEISLAVTASRWKEMVGQKGTRGFTSRLLGVLADHEVIRCPELPTCEEQLRERHG